MNNHKIIIYIEAELFSFEREDLEGYTEISRYVCMVPYRKYYS